MNNIAENNLVRFINISKKKRWYLCQLQSEGNSRRHELHGVDFGRPRIP